MWLPSMNQRCCGSALPYFLLCFLEHPGVAQPQQAQQGWRLGPLPSSHPSPHEGDQGLAALGHRNPPERGIWGGAWGQATKRRRLVGEMGRKRRWGVMEPQCAAAAQAQHGVLLLSRLCPPAHPAGPPQRYSPLASHQLSSHFSSPSASCSPTSAASQQKGRQAELKAQGGQSIVEDSGDKAWMKSISSGTSRKERTSAPSEIERKIMKVGHSFLLMYLAGFTF